MTDSSIPDVPAFADELSPLERAELGLQNELSVCEIGQLTYPKESTRSKREQLTDYLLKVIKGGQLAAYGDPDGWPVIESSWPSYHTEHLYPRCDGHKGSITPDYSQLGGLYRGSHNPFDPFSAFSDYDRPYKPRTHWRTQYEGDWCLVTRADYLAFVESPAAHGIPFPDSWKAPHGERVAQLETSAEKPEGLPLPVPQSELDRPGQGAAKSQKRKRQRVDALGEAIEAALEVLSHDGRLPTQMALFEYLLTQDKTGVVIPGDSKTVFYWYASNGNKQSADISTIAKRLDRMKRSN